MNKRARELAAQAHRHHTRRAYDGARARYVAWCHAAGLEDLEPGSVAPYIAARHDQGRSAATLALDMTAIRRHFAEAGAELALDAEDKLAVQGARRSAVRANPPTQAPALRLEDLRETMRELARRDDPTTDRDRALLLIMYFGALRRSELAALVYPRDIVLEPRGITLRLAQTKTSDTPTARAIPAGHGHTDPVAAWRDYLTRRGEAPGAAFVRSAPGGFYGPNRPIDRACRPLGTRAIDRILTRALERAGIADPHSYSAHSLRAGIAVELSAAGVPLAAIMEHGGWKSAQVATGYARRGRLWDDCPLGALVY